MTLKKIITVNLIASTVIGCTHVWAYDNCGYYQQAPCSSTPICQSNMVVVNGRCVIPGMNAWTTYPLDTSRGNKTSIDPNGQTVTLNAWAWDDIERDRLDMNSNSLNNAFVLSPNMHLTDGRYIYVVRVVDKNMILRRYDRDYVKRINKSRGKPPTSIGYSYSDNRYPANYHKKNQGAGSQSITSTPCAPGTNDCVYDHVRHTQLNGTLPAVDGSYLTSNAWEPVYCAGELRVLDGKIDRINNASGHFKPSAVCVENTYTLLQALDMPLSSSIQKGDYSSVDTEEYFYCPDDDTSNRYYRGRYATACVYMPGMDGSFDLIEIKDNQSSICAAAGAGNYPWRWGSCYGDSQGFPWWIVG